MSRPQLSAAGKRALSNWVQAEVAKGTHPALFAAVATADEVLFFDKKGDKVFGQPHKGQVGEDTVLQLWSMTKLVTSVAVLQLVERGLLDVDDATVIPEHLPELASQPILLGFDDKTNQPITKPRTAPLTVRHLLTHTSGLAYSFPGTPLAKWEAATGRRSWTSKGAGLESITQPLLFEPGSSYVYGFGIDWAGVLVERLSGLTLEDYFRQHIWSAVPGGCRSLTFYPTRQTKRRMMSMHGRDSGGQVVPDPGWRDVASWDPIDIKFRFGGAGLLGTASDYIAFLQHLLACYQGRTGGILKPETAKLVFDDAFPARGQGNTAHKGLGRMIGDMGHAEPGWRSGDDLTHSLAMCVVTKDSPHGRRAGSAFWGGAARTQQWIDPKTGIIGFIGTQLLELDGRPFMDVLDRYERQVYDALEVRAKL